MSTATTVCLYCCNDADAAIAAGSGGHVDLGVEIIRITPAPAFEQPVRSSDSTKGDATRQIAALIIHATSALANVLALFRTGVHLS